MALAATLANTIMAQHPNTQAIRLLSTDTYIPKMCNNRNHRDLSSRLANLSHATTNLLNSFPPLQISIEWSPTAKGLLPIRRLKAAAAALARQTPDLPIPPPTKAHLRTLMRKEAISQWQERWRTSSKRQPAYLALANPPDGNPPPFIQGLTSFPRPVFATGIRPLIGHAFTGEYNARHRPQSNDPIHCQCGEVLQTAHHVITSCPTYAAARQRLLHPLSASLSLSTIFGTKKGGTALGAFLAETQACLRPRRQEPPPEDYG